MAKLSRDDAARFVTGLYRGVLRREPDFAGFTHYVALMQEGLAAADLLDEFVNSAEFAISAPAKPFVPPGAFYSPIVDTGEASRHLDALVNRAIPDTLLDVPIDRAEMVRTWRELLPFLESIPFTETKRKPFRYAFDNPTYGWADGSILHAMLRRHRPKRLIEIGSGWSSACALDTVDHCFNSPCALTFIEPYPKLVRDLIGSCAANVKILESKVQDVPIETFLELEAGDFLFIDSTHVLRTGSDVCFELFEILPRLAPGVFVHFHDMFWPFEYPPAWVVGENRSWNEAYAVRAFLSHNPLWRVIFFNDYFTQFEYSTIEATYPNFLRNPGGALWLRRL